MILIRMLFFITLLFTFSFSSSSTATCYALPDDSSTLYKVEMSPDSVPLPTPTTIQLSQTFNAEGTAYRATNHTLYAFKEIGNHVDMYAIDLNSHSETKIENNLFSGTVEGAEFYYNPRLEKEILYIISKEYNSKLYAFNPDDWSMLDGYPKNTNTDLSSLAINPVTGQGYAINDYDYHGDEPNIYEINLQTGSTTLLTQLSHLADAESLAYASDGNLYLEDEGRNNLSGRKIYQVNLQTGALTPAAILGGNDDVEGLSCNGTQIAIEYPIIMLDANSSVVEGNTSTTNLNFSVTLSKPAIEDIILSYSITDITTTVNEDYILESNLSIIIPKDASSAIISIEVKGDIDVEDNETLILELIDATNAVINPSIMVGTIIDDDAITQTPFTCSSNAYIFTSHDSKDNPTDVYTTDIVSSSFNLIAEDINPTNINAVGYNMIDNYIWGYDKITEEVKRVDANYTVIAYTIDGLPQHGYHAGDVSTDGILYLYTKFFDDGKKIYKVDVNPNSSTYLQQVGVMTLDSKINTSDFAFHPNDNMLYYASENRLYRINTNTSVIEDLGSLELNDQKKFIGTFFDDEGYFYIQEGNDGGGTGKVYRIDITNTSSPVSKAKYFSTFMPTGYSDGARCANAVMPEPLKPVAEYRFDECIWNGTANEVRDSSGNNLHGTAKGDATTTSDAKIGRAGYFDGEQDYVEIVDDEKLQLDADASWSLWIKPEQISKGRQGLVFKHYNNEYELIMEANGKVNFYHGDGEWEGMATPSGAKVTQGTWNHIVITRNASSQTLTWYINGQKKGTDTYVKGPLKSSNKLFIGMRGNNANYGFKGNIDEVKLFNGTLSDDDVSKIYNNENAGKNWDGSNREAVVCETPQEAFTCDETLYLSNRSQVGTGSTDSGQTWLHSINRDEKPYTFNSIGTGYTSNDGGYNAIGYNVKDNFIYGLQSIYEGGDYTGTYLMKIDSNSNVVNLGAITGLTTSSQLYAGEFDRNGHYYVTGLSGGSTVMYDINITTREVERVITLSEEIKIWDMAIDKSGEYFYSMLVENRDSSDTDINSWKNIKVAKIKISDGTVTTIGDSHANLHSSISLVFSDTDGDIFMMSNENGFYKVNTSTGELNLISSTSDLTVYNDGTSCPDANISEPPSVSISANVRKKEGNSGTTSFDFNLTFNKATGAGSSLSIELTDGTATHTGSKADYNGTTRFITFPENILSYNFTVDVIGDKYVEEDENFYVTLVDPTNLILLNANGMGTIVNDDAPKIKIERTNSDTHDNDTPERKASFYTQIAGKDFDYSIVSYNVEEDYNISNTTVKVELFDYNTTDIDNAITTSKYIYLDSENHRFDITNDNDLKIDRATRQAQFRLSFLVDENGSMLHGQYNNEEAYNTKRNLNGNKEDSSGYSDNFAIRPASYRIKLNDLDESNQTVTYATNNAQNQNVNLAAEYDYRLEAQAVMFGDERNASHYTTLSPAELNVTLDFDENGTTHCADTNTSEITNYNFRNGQLNEDLSHNNVGKYTLHIEDINWTHVDKNETRLGCVLNSSSNVANDEGRFGCNIASDEGDEFTDMEMTFQAYKFEFTDTQLTNINGNGKNYVYMSDLTQSQMMGVNLHSTITAKGKNNTTLTNFTDGCVAKKLQLSLDFNGISDQGSFDSNESFDLNSTGGTEVIPQYILRINDGDNTNLSDFNELNIPRASFLDVNEGNVTIDILYNMGKNFNDTTNPLLVNFITLDVNATDTKAKIKDEETTPTGKGDINSTRIFYFARVSSFLKNYPDSNKKRINTPLFVEVYCRTRATTQDWCRESMKLKDNNIIHNGQKTYEGWYLATEHNSTNEGRVLELKNVSGNSDKISTNYATIGHSFIDGEIKNIQTSYIADEVEEETKAEIEIITDDWLRFNIINNKNASYFVTIKPISGMAGVNVDSDNNGDLGYNLMRDKNGSLNGIVEKNGKMSW